MLHGSITTWCHADYPIQERHDLNLIPLSLPSPDSAFVGLGLVLFISLFLFLFTSIHSSFIPPLQQRESTKKHMGHPRRISHHSHHRHVPPALLALPHLHIR